MQVLELGDYSIVYRVAGLLTESKQLIAFRSRLRVAMLDGLHLGGVEIVSPQFNNARVLDAGLEFIPQPARRKSAPAADAAPVEVAFDKAEEAEGLDSRRKNLIKLEESLKELQKEAKEASEPEKTAIEGRISQMERDIEALSTAITEVEAKENEEND